MTATSERRGTSWTARLTLALMLFLAGGGLAIYILSQWHAGARFLGVAPAAPQALVRPAPGAAPAAPALAPVAGPAVDAARLILVEQRLRDVESALARAEGSAGRADAMLVALAARRAIDRGVALGILEPLLVERFGNAHERAVATVITASRTPVRLDQLVADYEALGPGLRAPGDSEGLWQTLRRELGGLVTIRKADSPSPRPQARYDRALDALRRGKVDQALAETMRLPGAARAGAWTGKARRYVATQRALDELETAALIDGPRARG